MAEAIRSKGTEHVGHKTVRFDVQESDTPRPSADTPSSSIDSHNLSDRYLKQLYKEQEDFSETIAEYSKQYKTVVEKSEELTLENVEYQKRFESCENEKLHFAQVAVTKTKELEEIMKQYNGAIQTIKNKENEILNLSQTTTELRKEKEDLTKQVERYKSLRSGDTIDTDAETKLENENLKKELKSLKEGITKEQQIRLELENKFTTLESETTELHSAKQLLEDRNAILILQIETIQQENDQLNVLYQEKKSCLELEKQVNSQNTQMLENIQNKVKWKENADMKTLNKIDEIKNHLMQHETSKPFWKKKKNERISYLEDIETCFKNNMFEKYTDDKNITFEKYTR